MGEIITRRILKEINSGLIHQYLLNCAILEAYPKLEYLYDDDMFTKTFNELIQENPPVTIEKDIVFYIGIVDYNGSKNIKIKININDDLEKIYNEVEKTRNYYNLFYTFEITDFEYRRF